MDATETRVRMLSEEFRSVPQGTEGVVLEIGTSNSPAIPSSRVRFDNGRVLWLYNDELEEIG